jgi:hypothetical protein
MAIKVAEIGASCSVDAGGTLQIKFGLYLPGIRSNDGFGVLVRVVHDADRFDPAVPPTDVAMVWAAGGVLDLWNATTTLTPTRAPITARRGCICTGSSCRGRRRAVRRS